MIISASIKNKKDFNNIILNTDKNSHSLDITTKPSGYGSIINGGELLFLALATCFCNDIYREAEKRKMKIESVYVEVTGEFGGVGEPAKNIVYTANVNAPEYSKEDINHLLEFTDKVAEIHNTLRLGVDVKLLI